MATRATRLTGWRARWVWLACSLLSLLVSNAVPLDESVRGTGATYIAIALAFAAGFAAIAAAILDIRAGWGRPDRRPAAYTWAVIDLFLVPPAAYLVVFAGVKSWADRGTFF